MEEQLRKVRKGIFTIHVVYWLIVLPTNFYMHTWPWYTGEDPWFWVSSFYGRFLTVGYFYVHYCWLVPNVLLKKQYWQYFIITIPGMALYAILTLTAWNFNYVFIEGTFHYEESHLRPLVAVCVAPVILSTGTRIIENWIKSEVKKKYLEKLSTDSKIDFLKILISSELKAVLSIAIPVKAFSMRR